MFTFNSSTSCFHFLTEVKKNTCENPLVIACCAHCYSSTFLRSGSPIYVNGGITSILPLNCLSKCNDNKSINSPCSTTRLIDSVKLIGTNGIMAVSIYSRSFRKTSTSLAVQFTYYTSLSIMFYMLYYHSSSECSLKKYTERGK